MEVRQDVECVIQHGLWLASDCHGIPAPAAWCLTYTDKPKQSYKIFCSSILSSEADKNKSEFIFLNRSLTAHKKGKIYFYFFSLLLPILLEAEVKISSPMALCEFFLNDSVLIASNG